MAMAAGLWGSSTNLFIAATMGHCSVELEKNRSQSCKIASRPKMDFKSSLLAVRPACFDKWLQFQLILFQAKYVDCQFRNITFMLRLPLKHVLKK